MKLFRAVKSQSGPRGDDKHWCTWWRHQLGAYACPNAVQSFASARPAYPLGSVHDTMIEVDDALAISEQVEI